MQHIIKPSNVSSLSHGISPQSLGLSLSPGIQSYSLIGSAVRVEAMVTSGDLYSHSGGLRLAIDNKGLSSTLPLSPHSRDQAQTGESRDQAEAGAKTFATWSLFLISNQRWLRRDSSPKIASLFESYTGFARAIGEDHAAVWFGDSEKLVESQQDPKADLAALIDTNACARFAQKLQLDRSKSPHILITTTFPDIDGEIKDYILLQLNGLKLRSVDKLLDSLSNGLENIHLSKFALKSKNWWLGWEQVAAQALEQLWYRVKNVDIELNTGIVKIKLSAPRSQHKHAQRIEYDLHQPD
jgi:hypothetical protein